MSNPWDDLSKEAQDALIDFGELELAEAYVKLSATIQRVRDLHVPHGNDCGCLHRDFNGSCFHAGTCRGCGRGYPCPTVRALDQEDQS